MPADASPADAAAAIPAVIADLLPAIRPLAAGPRAIAIGGSRGKGLAAPDSDVDVRLFCDEESPDSAARRAALAALDAAVAAWGRRGVAIDGCWVRRIGDIERELDAWLAGTALPTPKVWTVWGYHLPTDLAHLHPVEDAAGVIAGWRQRLRVYPAALGRALLDQHLASLAYWRDDYHYRNKARRGTDAVFLASLSARLAHDLLQVLCALNRTYFPGDGDTLRFSRRFAIKPDRFEERIAAALATSPDPRDRAPERQRAALIGLIDEVAALAPSRPNQPSPPTTTEEAAP